MDDMDGDYTWGRDEKSSLVPREETDLILGAPPLLPPRLKRARAGSFTPCRNQPFGASIKDGDEPHQ